VIFALKENLTDELDFIDGIAESNTKNYQIYHHRQRIVDAMASAETADLARELDFASQLIEVDHKNYHVWSYRY
jgi:protein farnesyltransferase/geranylgeranyltransferase type-1 subunit alpha